MAKGWRWGPIIEGWTDSYYRFNEHHLTLSSSSSSSSPLSSSTSLTSVGMDCFILVCTDDQWWSSSCKGHGWKLSTLWKDVWFCRPGLLYQLYLCNYCFTHGTTGQWVELKVPLVRGFIYVTTVQRIKLPMLPASNSGSTCPSEAGQCFWFVCL